MTSRRVAPLIVALALLLSGSASQPSLAAAEARGQLAAFSLKRLDGKMLRSSMLKGKVTVLAFWASWCSPCKLELSALADLRARLKRDDLEVVAVTADGPETISTVRSLVAAKKWQLTVASDAEGQLGNSLNPRGHMPHSVFVDRAGRIAYAHTGFKSGDEKIYDRIIEQLLAEPAP